MDYKTYKAQQQTRSNNQNGTYERKPVHFMGEFLKNNGDFVIVRFPYHSMDDVTITRTHLVKGVFENNQYGKRVVCTEDDTCPLCADGVKTDDRIYVKLVVYQTNNGKVEPLAAIWDRSAAFADIELAGKMEEYGDLTNYLFKVKRIGSGKDTKYDILPVMNPKMYPESEYVKDFSCLDDINPIIILTKSVDQYLEAAGLKPKQEKTESSTPAQVEVRKVEESVPEVTVEAVSPKEVVVETSATPQPVSSQSTERKKYVF